MENLHIVFWLFKDIGGCLFWKPLGLVMIIPTLFIYIMIAYRTRDMVSELCHNLAITFWDQCKLLLDDQRIYGFLLALRLWVDHLQTPGYNPFYNGCFLPGLLLRLLAAKAPE